MMFAQSFMLRSLLFLLSWKKSLKQTSNLLLVTAGPGSCYGGGSGSGYDGESGSGYDGESGSGYDGQSGSGYVGEAESGSPLYVYEDEELHLFYKDASYIGHRLVKGIFQTTTVTSLIECLLECTNAVTCLSINYREASIQEKASENCELIHEVSWNELHLIKDPRYTHYTILLEYIEETGFCSSSPCANNMVCDAQSQMCVCTQGYNGKFCEHGPPPTCYDVRMYDMDAKSGLYWIQPLPEKQPIYVYCDMETQGGMWTLVYSYTFTNYPNFETLYNAVTPRPSWPASQADVPVSISSPTSNTIAALDFSLWEHIGWHFLIKSNINDWIFCSPETGSLVIPDNGTVYCRNIKNVTSSCSGFVPDKIAWMPCGPKIYGRNTMYYFDGCTREAYPTHNPCELSWRDNQKKGVSNANGSIFLRP